MKPFWRTSVRYLTTAGLATLLPVGAALNAQQAAPRTPNSQAFCDSATSRVTARSVTLVAAAPAIASCAAETASLLPEYWRTAAADSAELNALIDLSKRVRDRRLLSEVRSLALARGKPYAVRGAALIVLANYIYPTLSGSVHTNKKTGELTISIGMQSHASQVDGPEPLGEAEYAEIGRVVKLLAEEKGPTEIDGWAKYVREMTRLACQRPQAVVSVRSCPQ